MIKFGTDGWRAIISDEFTFENVRKVASAIALYLIEHKKTGRPLIIGYDPRFLADQFAFEVAKVMKDLGINVLLPDRDTPTPVIAWSVKDKKACGAVMLTASHNPPQYCGIKFIPEYAGPANEEITKEIEENISSGKKHCASTCDIGEIKHFKPREKYIDFLSSLIDFSSIKGARLKIIYDSMHGSGRGYTDYILQNLNCNIESINNFRDVLFGGNNPEPSSELLYNLKEKVKETKADLGLANDGDADRFGIVDEAGVYYSANQIIAMLFEYLLVDKKLKGSVVRTVGTTSMIDEIALLHKVNIHETPVGFKHIADWMMKEDVIIGGEESGGLSIKGHIPEKDGILANLLVVEMVAKRKKSLSRIWDDLVLKIGLFKELRKKLALSEDQKNAIIKELGNTSLKEIEGVKISEVRKTDGIKVILKDGSWFLCRPSGTEPVLRIYAESKEEKILNGIDSYLKSLVNSNTLVA